MNARLQGANLDYANVTGADFREAHLEGTHHSNWSALASKKGDLLLESPQFV